MKNKRQPILEEQTLFSELQFEEPTVESKNGHDKILEARQNVSFESKDLGRQEDVQVVKKLKS